MKYIEVNMNKKIIASLLLVLCMTFVAAFAVSCDTASDNSTADNSVVENSAESSLPAEDDSSAPADYGKVTYTVTVVDENNTPLEGITIQFCDDANCKMPVVTDADGRVSVEYDESNYHITITEAEGYTFEAQYDFEEGSTELTVTLTAE